MLTVLMSCYNTARFLPEAIESVLRQTIRNFEFLIIDDGSLDNSADILRSYAARDSRIRLLLHKKNRGMPVAALNEAMAAAKHEWLFRFDPDDVMLPDRLERQSAFLHRHPDLAVASGLGILIDANGAVLGRSRSPYTTRDAVARAVAGPALIGFLHPAAAMRKSVVMAAGGYRPNFWPADDLDLWNRLADAGHPMLVQEEFLIKYRQHGTSSSAASNRSQITTTEWIADCKARRRQSLPEESFQEYLAKQAAQPWPARLNQYRRITGRALYKTAVLHLAQGHSARFAANLLAAGAMEPKMVWPRIWNRLRLMPMALGSLQDQPTSYTDFSFGEVDLNL